MFKKISLMLLILCLILAGCAVTGTKSTIPAEKQVSTGSARIQAGQQENDGTDNDNVNKAGSEDPTQSKKDQSPSSLSDQKETVEQDAVINEGSSDSKKGKGGQVELLITRDFGQQVILHELVTLDSGWTIMDLLQAKCDVKTRYGGGFIDSINQLKSSTGGLKGEMQDWFYYVNGICPDDRQDLGILADQSVENNIIFTGNQIKNMFRKKSLLPFSGFIDHSQSRKHVDKMIQDFDIKCTSLNQKVKELSGGNQQKVCIARALTVDPRLLFVAEPTRGVDISAKEKILHMLLEINRSRNTTIVIASSELEELKRICDRIAVMVEGRIFKILSPDASDEDFGLALSGEGGVEHEKF
jgi:ABC-type dipeptide/oligopeptide/nickel transport system ATPase subunit